MNGETGVFYGTRPYALRSGVLKLLTLNFLNPTNTPNIELGSSLNAKFTKKVYQGDLHYVTFPPSDQFLWMLWTGYIVLANTGEKSITLQAQRKHVKLVNDFEEERITEENVHGTIHQLLPHSSEGFDYTGAWVIAILDGNKDDLRVEMSDTSGGGYNSIAVDKLGMNKSFFGNKF